MRIAHVGGFDADNFGDQLLPLIFEARLDARADVRHFSPTGRRSVWSDSANSTCVDRLADFQPDAVVIGGGNIIYHGNAAVHPYLARAKSKLPAYPAMWLGPTVYAAANAVPVVWNAPGVRGGFEGSDLDALRWAASTANYLAVRDCYSAAQLQKVGIEALPVCVADTALGVRDLWSPSELSSAQAELFERRSRDVPRRYAAFHVNRRYVDEPLESVRDHILRICELLDAEPVLLALGLCHGDEQIGVALAQDLGPHVVLLGAEDRLIEFAACIAGAEMYVGSSLHGFIAATSFGRPALAVAKENPTRYRKFTGFLEHVRAIDGLVSSWAAAVRQMASSDSKSTRADIRHATSQLDKHWNCVIDQCTARGPGMGKRSQCPANYKLTSVVQGQGVGQQLDRSDLNAPADVSRRALSVDVVICVRDALADVERCLQAVEMTDYPLWKLIVVNDGSNIETSNFLRQFQQGRAGCMLIENKWPTGYTLAANQAIAVTSADVIVLLNADTLVPSKWLTKITDCFIRHPQIGMLSPISNAAGWQSVPATHDSAGDWLVNDMPPGYTCNQINELLEGKATNPFVAVPHVNGFCLGLRRALLDTVGAFDPSVSPCGYGEEIDLSFRASDSGFINAVLPTLYVFHAKSRSYGHARRLRLADQARSRLRVRYGNERLERSRERLRMNSELADLRLEFASMFERRRCDTGVWPPEQHV